MKIRLLASTLLLIALGCNVKPIDPDSGPTPTDDKLVLAALLDGAADVVQNDANLKPEPRIVNTAKVAALLALAFEYRVGQGDKMDSEWRKGFSDRYTTIFEPDGEVQELTASRRASVVEFLRQESEALRGQEED